MFDAEIIRGPARGLTELGDLFGLKKGFLGMRRGKSGKFFGGEGDKFHKDIIARLDLRDGGAGGDVEMIGVGGLDASVDFEKGSGGNHGGVVARERLIREEGR